MNLYENIKNNQIELYHFDNTKYDIGNNIYGKHQTRIHKDIIKAYSDALNMNADELLYMLDYVNEEYYEAYKYCYKVETNGYKKVYMNFSPIMAQDFYNYVYRIMLLPYREDTLVKSDERNESFNNIKNHEFKMRFITEGYVKAYLNGLDSIKDEYIKSTIFDFIDVDKKTLDEIEYITDKSAKVIECYEDSEENK